MFLFPEIQGDVSVDVDCQDASQALIPADVAKV